MLIQRDETPPCDILPFVMTQRDTTVTSDTYFCPAIYIARQDAFIFARPQVYSKIYQVHLDMFQPITIILLYTAICLSVPQCEFPHNSSQEVKLISLQQVKPLH